jgi:LysM repeat protein
MKQSTYILLGLLVIMMAIAYFIQRPTDVEDVTYSTPDIQLSLNPAHVVKIEIDRNKQYLRLERIKDLWKLTEPLHYEVDNEAIKELLEGMGKFKIVGLVSSNPEKQKVFQVNEQGASVIFTSDDGKSMSLIVGKTDSITRQTFVRPASSTSVYIAQGLTASMVNRRLSEWRQRTIYRTDPGVVQLVSITSGSRNYMIRKQGGIWSTDKKAVPTSLVSPALNALSYLRADDFVDTALIIDSSPKMHVEMTGLDLLKLDVYPRGSNSSQYFLKTSASQNAFVINDAIPKELTKLMEFLAPTSVVAAKQEIAPPITKQPTAIPPTKISTTPPKQLTQTATPPSTRKAREVATRKPTEAATRKAPEVATRKPTATTRKTPEAATRKAPETITQKVPEATTPKATEAASKPDEEGELTIHTVKKGETMTTIAKSYNVSVEQILKWNLLKSIAVKPGQEIYIFVRKK